jgi:heme/copper-type cytochrome/quinol oxidase subunit 2
VDAPDHLTTRRGFIAATSFAAVSLYGLWVAFDAAPLPFVDGHGEEPSESGGHGGHGAMAGPSPEEFRRATEAFIEQYRQADGSVTVPSALADHAAHGAPADVYLMAYRWGFEPSTLRLDAGGRYRFRMMAVDVSHGAGVQLGLASHIVRLPAGVMVDQVIGFSRPGNYLVYCTTYCGVPHHRMNGAIVVA